MKTKLITDEERLDWLENQLADVTAPDSDHMDWVVHLPDCHPGCGIGCDRSLRKAIDKAMASDR